MTPRPHHTKINAQVVRVTFNGKPSAKVKFPKIIDYYCHIMIVVDISDQYRSYYTTQLTVYIAWTLLLLLDTTIVNAYKVHSMRRDSLSQTVSNQDGMGSRQDSTRQHIQLKPSPTHPQGTHRKDFYHQEASDITRHPSYARRPLAQGSSLLRQILLLIMPLYVHNQGRPQLQPNTQTTFLCETCQFPLCMDKARNCFCTFHKYH
jgi:hypothetical protein